MSKIESRVFCSRLKPIENDWVCKWKGVIFSKKIASVVEDDSGYVSSLSCNRFELPMKCDICKYGSECIKIMNPDWEKNIVLFKA